MESKEFFFLFYFILFFPYPCKYRISTQWKTFLLTRVSYLFWIRELKLDLDPHIFSVHIINQNFFTFLHGF